MDNISIHALCEEGDPENVVISKMPEISIHALCEEGDGAGLLLSTCKQLFLSTPSARRATTKAVNVSPKNMRISIHALCEEGDPSGYRRCKPLSKFLSTPSARRATAAASAWQTAAAYFYPRPLRGGRRGCAHGLPLCKNFYPRPLRGGRRGKFEQSNLDTDISIHALCEEGDPKTAKINANSNDFYPRPPRGGRQ